MLGVALYLGSSVFYAFGIRGGQLSVLYPMVSLGYIWTLVWSRLFFQEPFTRNKVAGLALILLGVVLRRAGQQLVRPLPSGSRRSVSPARHCLAS